MPRGGDKTMESYRHTGAKNPSKVKEDNLLVTLRHISGKRRSIHAFKVDVLEGQIAVHFHEPTRTPSNLRLMTEWFDRKFWSMGDQVPYVGNRLTQQDRLAEINKRAAERKAVRVRKNVGLRERAVGYRAKAKAEKNRIVSLDEVPAAEPVSPPVVVAAPDPDALTPEEAKALSGGSSVPRVGDLNKELPCEYNAQLHMKTDKHPFGEPEKLVVFDALVSQEATTQEAKRKIAMMRARQAGRLKPDLDGSMWGPE